MKYPFCFTMVSAVYTSVNALPILEAPLSVYHKNGQFQKELAVLGFDCEISKYGLPHQRRSGWRP